MNADIVITKVGAIAVVVPVALVEIEIGAKIDPSEVEAVDDVAVERLEVDIIVKDIAGAEAIVVVEAGAGAVVEAGAMEKVLVEVMNLKEKCLQQILLREVGAEVEAGVEVAVGAGAGAVFLYRREALKKSETEKVGTAVGVEAEAGVAAEEGKGVKAAAAEKNPQKDTVEAEVEHIVQVLAAAGRVVGLKVKLQASITHLLLQ